MRPTKCRDYHCCWRHVYYDSVRQHWFPSSRKQDIISFLAYFYIFLSIYVHSFGGIEIRLLYQLPVSLRRARLVLRWATVSGFNSRCRTFISVYVTNQSRKADSAFHPSGVGKWLPASAGKAKARMVHSVSGRMRGVQVKLWDPLRTRAIPQRLRGVFTSRRYTNPRLPLPLPYIYHCWR